MKTRCMVLAIVLSVCVFYGIPALCKTGRTGAFHMGEAVPMGEGWVRSWVAVDAAGKPSALGFVFDRAALSGLPDRDTEYVLDMPSGVPPFNHLQVYWNPHGHIPEHVYDTPHFDFHFYMITPDEREAMVLNAGNMAAFQKSPLKEYVPEGYMFAPGSEIDRMGSHWIDTSTPELHGGSFTETFIYGSYNGRVTFLEPMVNLAFLETNPSIDKPVKQPKAYEARGYYPTRYAVKYEQARDRYYVALQGLVYR